MRDCVRNACSDRHINPKNNKIICCNPDFKNGIFVTMEHCNNCLGSTGKKIIYNFKDKTNKSC